MIKLECFECGIIFKCNGDKLCEGQNLTRGCYCKKCTIEKNLLDDIDACYREEQEKVSFT